jgi:hypothetical protein
VWLTARRSSDRDDLLDTLLLQQRPDAFDEESLKMLARNVSIERILIAINLP